MAVLVLGGAVMLKYLFLVLFSSVEEHLPAAPSENTGNTKFLMRSVIALAAIVACYVTFEDNPRFHTRSCHPCVAPLTPVCLMCPFYLNQTRTLTPTRQSSTGERIFWVGMCSCGTLLIAIQMELSYRSEPSPAYLFAQKTTSLVLLYSEPQPTIPTVASCCPSSFQLSFRHLSRP